MMTQTVVVKEKNRNNESQILKQNNLIECSFEELDTWSEIHHNILNELIAVYQQNDLHNLFGEEYKRRLFIKRKTLERNISIRRKTNNEILELFKKMRDTSFTIKNIFQENGYKTTALISFFDKVFLHEHPGKDSYFEIVYSELFALLCDKDYSLKYGNYSKLNIFKITNIKSKYGKCIFELLIANKYRSNRFTIKEEDLKKYLKYNVKDYRFSYLVREIKKSYEMVKKFIDFEYIIHKQEKCVTFIINSSN